jgi:hypothetical protein
METVTEMATYKGIEWASLDRSAGNYGKHDEGRYDAESPEMQNLMAEIMRAGNGERGVVISPITIAPTDNGFKLISGYRRVKALELLQEQGKEVPDKIDARFLTKAQAEDKDFLRRLMIMEDTTQQRISAFAKYTGIFERFNYLKETLRKEDGSVLTDTEVKTHMIAETGVSVDDSKLPAFVAAREEINTALRAFEMPDIWLAACRKGLLSPQYAVKGFAQLKKTNSELDELGFELITPEIVMDEFPEGFSLEKLRVFLQEQLHLASLEKNKEKILKGLELEPVADYDQGYTDLETLDTLKKQAKESGIDSTEIYSRAKELAEVEGEGQELKVDVSHVKAAVEALEEENPTVAATIETVEAAAKKLKKILNLSLDDSFEEDELGNLQDKIESATRAITRLLDKHAKRLAKAEQLELEGEVFDGEAA